MRAGNQVAVSVSPLDFEKEIEASFAREQRRVFWPEQFEKLGSLKEATEALMRLAEGGRLRCVVELRCGEGHSVWSDDIDKVDEGKLCECPECAPGTRPESPFIHFEVTERWLQDLDKKKSPESSEPQPKLDALAEQRPVTYDQIAELLKIMKKQQPRATTKKSKTEAGADAKPPTRSVPHWAILGGLAVVAITVLAGFYIHRKFNGVPDCQPGLYPKDGACVPGTEPTDLLARCIIQDAKVQTKGGMDAQIESQVRQAKNEAKTLAQLRDNFEKTVEKTANECVLLDVNAKCFAIVTKTPQTPLPERCR